MRKRAGIILGDSILASCVQLQSLSASSISGSTLTISGFTHNFAVGNKFAIQFSNVEALNNIPRTVSSINSTTSFNTLLTAAEVAAVAGATTLTAIPGRTLTMVSPNFARAQGPLNWLRALIRGGFDIVGMHAQNGAVSGPYSGELAGYALNMLSVAQLVIPLYAGKADFIIITAGSNDFSTQTVDFTFGNLLSIGNLALQYGMMPILMTPTAVNSAATGWSVQTTAWLAQLRDKLLALGRNDTRFKVVDLNQAMTDPNSATAAYFTNYNADDLHTSENGGYQGAKKMKAAMNLIFPDVDIAPSSCADAYISFDGTSTNTLTNAIQILRTPLMTSTGGGTSGTGITGTIAKNWTVTNVSDGLASIAASLAARADGYGNNQVLAVVSTNTAVSRGFFSQSGLHTSGMVAGQWYKGGIEIELSSATTVQALKLYCYTTVPGSSQATAATLESSSSPPYPAFSGTDTFYYETPPFLCQAGATSSEFRLELQFPAGGGSCTIKASRAFCIPVPAP